MNPLLALGAGFVLAALVVGFLVAAPRMYWHLRAGRAAGRNIARRAAAGTVTAVAPEPGPALESPAVAPPAVPVGVSPWG